MTDLTALGQSLSGALGDAVTGVTVLRGELCLEVASAEIVKVMAHLRDAADCEFRILVDVCGNDWPQRDKRFDVVYHLLSLSRNQRIRVKAQVGEREAIPSVISVYPAANWFERETFDMYGIALALIHI